MVSIVAHDPVIEKEIRNLLDILVDAGSGFHSQLVIHEEDGGLSVRTQEPMERGKEIIRLPRTVLMPGDQYAIDIVNDNFEIAYPDFSIVTDLQRRVIDKMYEIYNLTDKVKLHKKFAFLPSLKDVPELFDKIEEGRHFVEGPYKAWVQTMKDGMSENAYKKIVIETFVKTRPLGYSDPIRESSVSMIMPILDFMNHHWEGGTFSVGQGHIRKGDLTMQTCQPFEDSTECFAHYGVMDAFDTLIRYDFMDESAPVVRSVSVDLEGPAGDVIKVQNKMNYMCKDNLNNNIRDLRRHIPEITYDGDQMVLSHLLVPVDSSKFALFRTLNYVLEEYNKKHSKTTTEAESKAWCRKAQEKIIEANNAYYEELLDVINNLPEEKRESFGVSRIVDVVRHQQARMALYEIQD